MTVDEVKRVAFVRIGKCKTCYVVMHKFITEDSVVVRQYGTDDVQFRVQLSELKVF